MSKPEDNSVLIEREIRLFGLEMGKCMYDNNIEIECFVVIA